MMTDVGGIAITVDVESPLESRQISMSCTNVLRLQVFYLTIDAHPVAERRHPG